MNELEGLKKQRSTFRGVLTKLLKFASSINDNSPETIEEMRLKASRAKEILDKVVQIEASMFTIDSEVESKLDEFEESYYVIVAKLNDWIKKRTIGEMSSVNNDTSLNMTAVNTGPEVRLAKLQIPTFSGDYTEWQSFFDLFHSSIHSKESISPVQKFQYLMGQLRGDAFSLVKHFKVTEANYIEALRKLQQRYDRKRHAINAFIRSFIEQPSVQVASAANVRRILDTSDEVIRGLKAMGDQAESRDPWLIYLLLQKLDDETRSLWAQENTNNEFPSITEFLEFLIKRTDALESIKTHAVRPSKATTSIKPKISCTTITNYNCIICEKQHRLIECTRFKELPTVERRNLISSHNRCFNCLNPGHDARNCRIRGRCRQCSYKHHTLLHVDPKPIALTSNTEEADHKAKESTTLTHHSRNDIRSCVQDHVTLMCTVQAVLPTAIINVFDDLGVPRPCRALLDTASQASFITESMVQRLGLSRKNCRTLIAGIGEATGGHSRGITSVRFSSRFDASQPISLNALIIQKITSSLPAVELDLKKLYDLTSIELADPNFYKPGTIDMLLGAEIVFELFEDGNTKIGNSNLRAHKTKLGWVIGGTYQSDSKESVQSFATTIDIDATLRRFWTIEELKQTSKLTKEEEDCEEWFRNTTRRTKDGNFITKLPFRETSKPLGSTYQQALSRLLAMERRFKSDQQFRQLYEDFLKEYQTLGHMQKAHNIQEVQQAYILPHHGVFKGSSTTTKLRVVFDASAKSTTGVSLNQNLMVGPNIQSSLFQILTRFRQHPHVLVGDIEKMYRQIWVDTEDRKHQLILWRDEEQKIHPYMLNTVTYGTASASFMATRCLKELADTQSEKFPNASRAVKNDTYVDDLMTGSATLSDLVQLKGEIVKILNSGGFNLRKMCSNNQQMQGLLNNEETNNLKIFSDHPEPVKVLGIAWNSNTDNFVYQVNLDKNELHTKRTFLSQASKIFDPLGLLSPITIKIKILFQSLWLQKIEWDDKLPKETQSSWIEIRNALRQAPEIQIPRCITASTSITLHGFCDASKWAYAAAVYARSQSEGGFTTHLICAKTKVAPLKQISIPRLELMSAVLLTRLVIEVTEILSINITRITLWSDSKIVLDWLSSQPRRWTTFVANRTAEIIGVYKRDYWRHVPSGQNPADCATRGKPIGEIASNNLWWKGPAWLSRSEQCWPDQQQIPETQEDLQIDVYNTITISPKIIRPYDVISYLSQRYSSYFKLKKVLSYVLRYIHNLKTRRYHEEKRIGILTLEEMERANRKLAIYWQIKHFPEEYRNLQNSKAIPIKSSLRQLNPFLDTEGVMRVGGRLQKSSLAYNAKHPIVVSSKSPIATTITYDVHVQYQHPGTHLLMSLVRQNFWILRGKDVARKIFQRCVKCLKQKPRMMSQLMGQLPEDRVQYTVPFGAVGIDFCGPFKVHAFRRRGSIPAKAYLCIFVCFSTHAIHVEICMNLNIDSFLGALKRFISRRGLCHTIYCDNATNFVGTKNYLEEVYTFLKNNNNQISSNLLKYKVNWRFIPPAAPNQGGLWESAVKSVKTQITRTVGDVILTLEEFSTLVVQIEGLLNSRPICCSNDDEVECLTPAHFLIGRSIYQLPEPPAEQRLSSHARWNIVKHLYQQFWRRWQIEYLNTLQQRGKWKSNQGNLQLDDIVLLQDNNLPPAQWLMGRIVKLFPGDDGCVRVAEAKTKYGILKRPIQKMCRLPNLESDNDSTRGVCSIQQQA